MHEAASPVDEHHDEHKPLHEAQSAPALQVPSGNDGAPQGGEADSRRGRTGDYWVGASGSAVPEDMFSHRILEEEECGSVNTADEGRGKAIFALEVIILDGFLFVESRHYWSDGQGGGTGIGRERNISYYSIFRSQRVNPIETPQNDRCVLEGFCFVSETRPHTEALNTRYRVRGQIGCHW